MKEGLDWTIFFADVVAAKVFRVSSRAENATVADLLKRRAHPAD